MHPDLFPRLERGALVVTPNRRLARHWRDAYARAQLGRGRSVWATPRILPWRVWLESLWDELSALALDALPLLLSEAQENAAWEGMVRDETLLSHRAAARLACEAWNLVHAWQGDWRRWRAGELDQDAARFVAWARNYARRCDREGWLSPACLVDALRERVGDLALPPEIVIAEFATLDPQQRAWMAACRDAGASVQEWRRDEEEVVAQGVSAADSREEMVLAAQWAAEAVERNPGARVAIVVNDLQSRRSEVEAILDDFLRPRADVPGAQAHPRPFNLSLGLPLAQQPLVHAALLLLELAHRSLPVEQVGVILRSRFLLQGDSETISRSRLERRLRDEGRNELTASQLATVARGHGCAALSAALERLPALPMGSVGAAQWREFWEAALSVLGWPGEGSLDSTEYQAREAWDRLLGTWGQLGTVRGPLPEDTAFASLSALAREVPFQPESDDVPIQVLGMLEAAGMEFEGIWIAGLDANAWPAAPRPQPFLPIAWQRRVGLPRATAESELHFARTLMQGYARCTRELKASYARQVGDEVCLPSPLIPAIAESAPPPRGEGDAQRMLDSRRLEPRSADAGIPLQLPQALKGGARLFEAQAACPFRAYGWFRLRAEGWPAVQHGITPSERGRFVHDALERFWKTTKTHAELVALRDRGALHDTLEACVETTLQQGGSPRWRALPPFVRDAERSALQRVLAEWLAVEAERAPFTVEGVEERLPVSIAGVEVQVKLDRIDRNAQGERILIDYKTGQPKSVQALFGPRPDAPQLPLYSCALGAQPPDVVAFGYVRRGQAEAVGVSRDVYDWSKVKAAQKLSRLSGAADWEALLALWRGALEGLAAAYAGGTAEVAPKRYPQTCGICDLRPLCRVSESRGADADQGDEDA